jgi:hypothetical protein
MFDRLKMIFGRKKIVEGTEFKLTAAQSIFQGQTLRGQTEREMERDLGISQQLIRDSHLQEIIAEPDIPEYFKALATYISSAVRTSIIDKKTAELCILDAELDVEMMIMEMEEDEYEAGGAMFLHSILALTRTAFNDAIEGKKAYLTKAQEYRYGVQFPKEQKRG